MARHDILEVQVQVEPVAKHIQMSVDLGTHGNLGGYEPVDGNILFDDQDDACVA